MLPHLTRPGSRINLGQLQEAANKQFLDILYNWEGSKVIKSHVESL